MIKVGDKFLYHEELVTIAHINFGSIDYIDNEGITVNADMFYFLNYLYEQQKQHADHYEKRWNKLKERMKHDCDEAYAEESIIDWNVFLYVLEIMNELDGSDS